MSRRHDWWRVTGSAGAWMIPDWVAVAADYDAVHLTVGGYLTTAEPCLDRRRRPNTHRRLGPRPDPSDGASAHRPNRQVRVHGATRPPWGLGGTSSR